MGKWECDKRFCYIDDIANGLILITKKYNKVEPLNLGSGKEIFIKKIAHLIKNITGYNGKIRWLKYNRPKGEF